MSGKPGDEVDQLEAELTGKRQVLGVGDDTAWPWLSSHLVNAVIVAVICGLVEAVICLVRREPSHTFFEALEAGYHIFAMSVPPLLAASFFLALMARALDAAQWSRPWYRVFARPWLWKRRDSESFAMGVAMLAALGFVGAATGLFAHRVTTTFHDPALAATAIALGATVLFIAALVMGAVAYVLGKLAAPRLGALGTMLGVFGIAVLIGIAAVVGIVVFAPRLFEVLDPLDVFWLPGLLLLFLAVAWLHAWRRSKVGTKTRTRIWLLVALGIGLAATLHSSSSYGNRNRVRSLVEQKSVSGGSLVRGYTVATDWDADGYGFAFGGHDCDDANPDIHPGAFDKPGDGVDSDCFAGDSKVDVADLSDGRYGDIPDGIDRPNILLIMIDALRPDRLGAFGATRETSPRIDRFAKEAVVFEDVTSQSPRSIRSIPSVMTGRYPSQIAYGDEYLYPSLLEENVTAAELLRDSGYETGVVIGTEYFRRVGGFFQGFEHVVQGDQYRSKRDFVVDNVLQLLDRFDRETPEPQAPSQGPTVDEEASYDGGVGTRVSIDAGTHRSDAGVEGRKDPSVAGHSELDETAKSGEVLFREDAPRRPKPWFVWAHLFNVHEPYLKGGPKSRFGDRPIDKYDTEVRLADEQVGRLLDQLSKRGVLGDTVVIVASDHGEAFGEHGHSGHSRSLYQEETKSVLMMRVPGVYPKRMKEPVALMDLGPTMLNLANVRYPEKIPARSLVPLMTREKVADQKRLIFSEVMPDGMFPFDQKAVRRGHEKLIWWQREGMFQLFDLIHDPEEKTDLSDEQRDKAQELLSYLRAWMGQTHLEQNVQQEVVAKNRISELPQQISNRTDINFGGLFTFLGADIPKRSFSVGDRIPIDLYFRVNEETRKNLLLHVDLVGPDGYRYHDFHAHHFPINGRYRTFEWKRGELLRDPVQIVVPPGVRRPITMKVQFSVRDHNKPISFHPNESGQSYINLGEIRIK